MLAGVQRHRVGAGLVFLSASDVYLLCLATGASDAKCPRVHQIVRAESSDAAVGHDGNGAGLRCQHLKNNAARP